MTYFIDIGIAFFGPVRRLTTDQAHQFVRIIHQPQSGSSY